MMNRQPGVFSQRVMGNVYTDMAMESEPLIYVSTDYVFQGWLEVSINKPSARGSWLKKSINKQWKWKFVVLVRPLEGSDRVALELYDKEENWNMQPPKKCVDMYPRYKVSKKGEFKGREFVLELSNEMETCYLAADTQKSMDLWVIQIQMQTKLSRSISGRIFSVIPTRSKALQRIGARDQRCLLHFTRWGLTLALQDSRSILALWPLSTIRNYECTGSGNFTFESGRRAPMGTGQYSFGTFEGNDEVMFNVIDAFVNARLNARAEIGGKKKEEDTTDEEVLATYDKLHSCALGLLSHEVPPAIDDYALIGPPLPSDPDFLISDPPPSYDHLANSGLIRTSSQSSQATDDDLGSCPPHSRNASFSSATGSSYDQLNRTRSWGTKSEAEPMSYDHLTRSVASLRTKDSYDHINWPGSAGATGTARFQSQPSYDGLRQPLTHEPSVPSIPDGVYSEASNGQRRRLTQQHSSSGDPFVYANAIYTPRTEFKPRPTDTATSPPSNGIKQKRSSVAQKAVEGFQQDSASTEEGPQLYPLTPISVLPYQNASAASPENAQQSNRSSLLSQTIEAQGQLPYQNLSTNNPVNVEDTNGDAMHNNPHLPSRSVDSIRFIPAK